MKATLFASALLGVASAATIPFQGLNKAEVSISAVEARDAPTYGSSSAPSYGSSSAPTYGSGSSSSNTNADSSVDGSVSGKLLSTGQGLYAMTYTPYKGTSPGNSRCASADEVADDIADIAKKGFKVVRLYATDCSNLENVGAAAKTHGLKLIPGIYVDHDGLESSEVAAQINDIKTYFSGDYSLVEAVLLGNEPLFNNFTTADALAAKLQSLKAELQVAGYHGPVSTADTLSSLQEHEGTLCDSLDILAANIHPFFNDQTSAANAGVFVKEQMTSLQGLCGGKKEAINSEVGWPNSGQDNGLAVPNLAEQATAIAAIKAAQGGSAAFFSYGNDLWKAPGYLSVEASWGCGSLF